LRRYAARVKQRPLASLAFPQPRCHCPRQAERRRSEDVVKVIGVLAVVLAVAVCGSAAARTTRGASTANSFCDTAHGVAKYLKSTLALNAAGVAAQTPANLKAEYTAVANAEANLRSAFGLLNLVKSDFEKADWKFADMAPYFPTLAARARATQRPVAAVKAYLSRTCHLAL
jgi:hypothetical protein